MPDKDPNTAGVPHAGRWDSVLFPVEFRKYQADMLAVFERGRAEGDRIFHFLAPPGSGKTLMGLEMIRRLGEPAVIFSPNSAIQAQWAEKLHGLTGEMSISLDPDAAADILSLSYQSISVKDPASGELHDNARRLLATLQARPTIVFDECHHLTAWWGTVVQDLARNAAHVIGLTATPPLDRERAAVNSYLGLLEDIDYQIPLPAIVKEGYLAPFNDLVYLTEPTTEEYSRLEQSAANYDRIMATLRSVEPPLECLQFWAFDRLERFVEVHGRVVPFDELFIQKPDLCIALARYVKAALGEVPLSVILCDEMDAPPTMDDMVEILADYANNHLLGLDEGRPLYQELRTALAEIGFTLSTAGIQPAASGIANILGMSRSKMAAMKRILVHEMIQMQDDFRCLVLTDYAPEKELAGTSALAVMKEITSDPETDPADPILVTGTMVLIDDDLLEPFRSFAADYLRERQLRVELSYGQEDGFVAVGGSGPDWNTRTYVLMVTRMFERGIAKTLVSTQALLGEGWDSIRLNTLIDLTVVSSYVAVNQIRGRSIRLDEDRPCKLANNWDIVTLTGNLERGFLDYERFLRKHAQYYGLSDDGVIEKGIGHVYPLFTHAGIGEIATRMADINSAMLERAADRSGFYRRWKIGEPFMNHETICMELVPFSPPGGARGGHARAVSPAGATAISRFQATVRHRLGPSALLAASGALALGAAQALGAGLPALAFACGMALLGAGVAASLAGALLTQGRLARRLGQTAGAELMIRACASAAWAALKELGEIELGCSETDIQITRRADGSFRVGLAASRQSAPFSVAVAEIFAPLQAQRYLICVEEFDAPQSFRDWLLPLKSSGKVLFPVPELFCTRRARAELFMKWWQHHVSRGQLFYTRQGAGNALLKEHFRKRGLPLHQVRKEIWV